MSIRFHADDDQLRPMGRQTSGVIGMRFEESDELLAMECAGVSHRRTAGGHHWRVRQAHPAGRVPVQGRGGKGVLTARIVSTRGGSSVRSWCNLTTSCTPSPPVAACCVPWQGMCGGRRRQTMGVRLIDLPDGVEVVAVARNAEEEPPVDGDAGEPGRDSA